ncbi:hypothetical protein PIIN_00443 [Serendipita indica DSM 11827]|uniref:Uncharacterized protein n=1 Tax=Serendipita indica (strain DSM 11827) TaxID=1109443 RepID=G4T5Y7_SERID|nr:hypothetical protein PIIN_00443 [Serendipita indica DSM 11827]
MNASQLEDLTPSVRHRTLAQASLKDVSFVRQAAAGGLRASDQGLCLLHSLDIEAILPALKHKSPQTRAIAINAFVKAWFRQTETSTPVIDAIGGGLGLATILNELTFRDAKKLSEKLGHNYRGATDPRTQVNDQLVSLLVPSISNDGPVHPISRLGSTLATNFIPACSPKIVFELLKLLDAKRDKNHLRRLLHTQPEVVGNLLLTPYDVLENPNLVFDQEDLKQLFSLRTIRTLSTPPGHHWGVDLFIKCMSAPEYPRLNFVAGISNNIDLGVVLLRAVDKTPYWTTLLELLISLGKTSKARGSTLSFDSWKPVVVNIASKLLKCGDGRIHGISTERLRNYLTEIASSLQQISMDNAVAALMPALVPKARIIVLRSLYRVDDLRTWMHPYPAVIKVATIALLTSRDGEPILRQVERHFGDHHYLSHAYGSTGLSNMFNLLNSATAAEPTDRDDAVSSTVRGRWANLEGDEAGKSKFKEWLERWKLKTHHQREPDGRVRYTRALLIIAAIVEDREIQKTTWAWVFERFIKDVNVRPQVFQSHMDLYIRILVGNSNDPVASARIGDEIVGAFIETMAEARKEPGFHAFSFRPIFSILRNILIGRLELCQRFRKEGTAKELIAPLADLFIRAEKIMLDDPGTFGRPTSHPACYNESYGTYTFSSHKWSPNNNDWGYKKEVNLSPASRKILVRFLEDLGQTRDGIYDDLRSTIGVETVEDKSWNGRFPWPYLVDQSFLRDISVDEYAPRLMDHLKKIILLPLGGKTEPIHRVYWALWPQAINLYAEIALNRDQDRDKMLLPVIEHFHSRGMTKNGRHFDLKPFLLSSQTFMKAVFSSEVLVDAFFESYKLNRDNFSEFELVPGIWGSPQSWIDAFKEYAARHQKPSTLTTTTLMANILPPITCRGSHVILRHLTLVCAILWLASRPGVETADQGYDMIEDGSTVNFVSLYALMGMNEKNRVPLVLGLTHEYFLAACIDLLSKEEIQNLSNSVKTLIPVKEDQPHRDKVLRTLAIGILQRSSYPTLLEEDIFEVLRDVKRSTIHRHFFTEGMLAVVSPDESRRLTRKFVEVISEGMAAQAQKSEKGVSGKMKNAERGILAIPKALRPEGEKKEEDEPTVKLSTIKYLATIVAQPVTTLDPEESCNELTRLASTQNVHPSVQDVVLQNLVQMLRSQIRLHAGPQLEPVWRTLEELAMVAVSLDERRMLTEKDWTRSKMPKITLRNTRPLRVLTLDIVTLPLDVRPHWASLVDNMFRTQAQQTHRWLLEYLKRKKIPDSELQWLVQAQFGPLLPELYTPCNSAYKSNSKYLPENSWNIRILNQQAIGFLYADKLYKFTAQLDDADQGWYTKEDGQHFIALRNQWGKGHLTAWDTLVGVHRELGGEDRVATLKGIIDTLLQPSNMVIIPEQPESRNTPWAVVQQMVGYFKPSVFATPQTRGEWKQHTRPMLEWTLDRVNQAQEQDGLSSVLYYNLITKIKLFLLPFPLVYGPEATYSLFVEQLFPLAVEAQNRPPALSPLQRFLDDLLGLVSDLLPDTPTLMTELCKKGEASGDVNARLLAYRLVQYFGGRASASLTKEQNEQVKQILVNMEDHPDEYVRLLALSQPQTKDGVQTVLAVEQMDWAAETGASDSADW